MKKDRGKDKYYEDRLNLQLVIYYLKLLKSFAENQS